MQKLNTIQVSEFEGILPSFLEYAVQRVVQLLILTYGKTTSDSEVLETVTSQKIEFDTWPKQLKPLMQPKVSDIQSISIDLEIAQLLQKGVIQPCYHEAGEYFCFLNLKSLNTHVTNHHFKIDNIWTAIGTMKPGCYMASIDLKDAYYSVAISSTDQKFLQFEWKGTLYQFACFPIGVALCPRKFTKLLKPVFFLFQAKRPHFSALYR